MLRTSSLLAVALGLAAIGSSLAPVAALTSLDPSNATARFPSKPAPQKTPLASRGDGVFNMSPRVSTGPTDPAAASKVFHPPERPAGQTAPSTGPTNPGPAQPAPAPASNPTPGAQKPVPCTKNISTTACTPVSPTPGAQGPWGKKPMPGGQYDPSRDAGPVVIFAPLAAVETRGTVITAARPAAAATEPCNCLTKQYLDDGSVLFRDICTKEAAMATPAELRAQAAQ